MLIFMNGDISRSGNHLAELHNHRYVALKYKFLERNSFEQLSIVTSRLHYSLRETSWFKYYHLDFAGV